MSEEERLKYLQELNNKAAKNPNAQGTITKRKSFIQTLGDVAKMAKDVRIGAVGAQQIRDLYKDGKTEEAQNLADKYYKANNAGIALGAGFASPNILTDLGITFGTTLSDAVPNYVTND
jgi:hypothetical protein